MNGIIFLSALLPMALAGDGETKKGDQIWSDDDGDGVHDLFDLCDGSDDSVDLDGSGTPDCSENFIGTGMFNDSSEAGAWWFGGSTAPWDATDAAAYAGSGSVDLDNGSAGTAYMFSPCTTISQGQPHILLMNVDADNATNQPLVSLRLYEFSSTDCSGSSSKQVVDELTSDTSGFDIMGGKVSLKSTTRSVEVLIYNAFSSTSSGATDAYVDNVLLHDLASSGTTSTGTSKH